MKEKYHTRIVSAAILAALGLAVSGSAQGAAIGINFVASGDGGVQNAAGDALGAGETAGVGAYAQANWNNFGRWGQTVGVNNESGAPVAGVSVTWDSNNTWNSGSGTAAPNNKLMHGYIDSLGVPNNNTSPGFPFFGQSTVDSQTRDNRPIVYTRGLAGWLASAGAPSYSVIVYADGDGTDSRRAEFWLQDASSGDPPTVLGADLTGHVFLNDTSNFSGNFVQVPNSANSLATAAEGNYIVFTGLSADSFLLRTEEQNFRAAINGFQIVAEVPEPGSAILLASGLLGLATRRRRSA